MTDSGDPGRLADTTDPRIEAGAKALVGYWDLLRGHETQPDENDYGQVMEVLAAADAVDPVRGAQRVGFAPTGQRAVWADPERELDALETDLREVQTPLAVYAAEKLAATRAQLAAARRTEAETKAEALVEAAQALDDIVASRSSAPGEFHALITTGIDYAADKVRELADDFRTASLLAQPETAEDGE